MATWPRVPSERTDFSGFRVLTIVTAFSPKATEVSREYASYLCFLEAQELAIAIGVTRLRGLSNAEKEA